MSCYDVSAHGVTITTGLTWPQSLLLASVSLSSEDTPEDEDVAPVEAGGLTSKLVSDITLLASLA